MTITVNCRKRDKFKRFTDLLIRSGLLETTAKGYLTVKDEVKFKNFGLGLYLGYVVSGIRTLNKEFCFVKIDNSHTLFVAKSNREHALFFGDKVKSIYINSAHDKFKIRYCTDSGKSGVCQFRRFAQYNASVLMTHKKINFWKSNSSCGLNAEKWYKNKVLKKEVFGKIFGGNPLLLNTPPELFEQLFTNFPEEELSQEIEFLFNSFLITWIGCYKNTYGCEPNVKLKIQSQNSEKEEVGFETYELDGFCWNKKMSKFIILETTIGQSYEKKQIREILSSLPSVRILEQMDCRFGYPGGFHLKQKIFNYLIINSLPHKKILYLYVSISPDYELDTEYKAMVDRIIPGLTNFKIIADKDNAVKREVLARGWNPKVLRKKFEKCLNEVKITIDQKFKKFK